MITFDHVCRCVADSTPTVDQHAIKTGGGSLLEANSGRSRPRKPMPCQVYDDNYADPFQPQWLPQTVTNNFAETQRLRVFFNKILDVSILEAQWSQNSATLKSSIFVHLPDGKDHLQRLRVPRWRLIIASFPWLQLDCRSPRS